MEATAPLAHVDRLPIYRAAYDLCLHVEQAVRKFPRYQKYTLGTDRREDARRASCGALRTVGTD